MGRVEIDEELCKGCELCTVTCPRRLLAVGSHFNSKGYRPVVFLVEDHLRQRDPEHPFESWRDTSDPKRECNACTLCARMCPDVAIKVYK